AGADESRREIAGGGEAVDDRGCGAEQQIDPFARILAGRFRFLALGDVGPRSHDLEWLALGIADDLLPVMYPDIFAVAANAIFDRASTGLLREFDPFVNARDVVGMHQVLPQIGV